MTVTLTTSTSGKVKAATSDWMSERKGVFQQDQTTREEERVKEGVRGRRKGKFYVVLNIMRWMSETEREEEEEGEEKKKKKGREERMLEKLEENVGSAGEK